MELRVLLQFFCVWVSVHHKLIYIKRTNVMQLGSMFICNCNIALHVAKLHHVGSFYIYSVTVFVRGSREKKRKVK